MRAKFRCRVGVGQSHIQLVQYKCVCVCMCVVCVCVWRQAETSRAGETESSDCVLTAQRECVCVVCVCVREREYHLSEHSLCVETGRHKQSWRARELRLCSHCTDGLIEDELHFLTECSKYKHIRDAYFKQIALVSPEFQQTRNSRIYWERRKSASTWQRSMCTPAIK